MAKYMECDVCGEKQDGSEPWIEVAIPAAFLGELGDDVLHVDVCSMECLNHIGSEPQQESPEETMERFLPEPDDIEPATKQATAEVYREMRDGQGNGKRVLRPVQQAPQAAPVSNGERYLTAEEIEEVTGVTRRW